MNEIVNKFLLAGEKFMPEMHLKQAGFILIVLVIYLIKTIKELKKLRLEKKTGNTDFIYKNYLDFNMIWIMVNQKI